MSREPMYDGFRRWLDRLQRDIENEGPDSAWKDPRGSEWAAFRFSTETAAEVEAFLQDVRRSW